MALAYVIDAESVRARLSLQDLPDVMAAINSALQPAHLYVQGLLNTTFEKTPHSEIFLLDSKRMLVQPTGLHCLRLKQAFLQAAPTVFYTDTLADILAGGTVVTDAITNQEKGLVYLPISYQDTYIRVSYTAGFDTAHEAPDWLREAVLSYMPAVLNYQQITHHEVDIAPLVKEIRAIAATIVEPHLRTSALQLRALY